MNIALKNLVTAPAVTMLVGTAAAQTAKDVRGASPYVTIENEPEPKLIVDQPLPNGLYRLAPG